VITCEGSKFGLVNILGKNGAIASVEDRLVLRHSFPADVNILGE
jgi:hypothetical protein